MKTIFRSLLLISILTVMLSSQTQSQNQTPADKFNDVSVKSIYSKILNEQRRLFIQLPENYKEDQKYPVLYLLDGELVYTYNEAIQALKTVTEAGTHIIVGIDNDDNRNRDMIPVKIESRPGSGGAGKFLDFLGKELLPYIDKNYNTNGKQILYGGSNSALFTVYAMFENPSLFFAYIASSPMVGHCPDFMYKKMEEAKAKKELNGKYLYIKYGLKDEYKQVTEYLPKYCKVLNSMLGKIIKTKSKVLKDGIHVPKGTVEDGLKYIYNN